MSVYKLRNGLSIDLKFGAPNSLTAGPAKCSFNPSNLYESKLDAHPFPIDANGQTIHTNLVNMNATGTLSGASADVFSKCSLRFIQVIKVQSFIVGYLGKRNDEGSVTWNWSNRLLMRNIDCWVDDKLNQDSAPFLSKDPGRSQHLPPNTLVCSLGDTPGAGIPLAERNTKSACDNYLRTFTDRRSFESIVTFVHPDNSCEMLESWKWGFSRSVALKWVKLRPEFDGTNSIVFTPAASSASVFGKDADYDDTLLSGRLANKLTNEALGNRQNSADISYTAFANPEFLWPNGFWSP